MIDDTEANQLQNQITNNQAPSGIGALGMDASEFLSRLLNNEHIPEEFKSSLFSLFSQNQKLTFLEEKDIEIYLLRFRLLRNSIVQSVPKAQNNSTLSRELDNIEIEFNNVLRQSLGDRKGNFLTHLMANMSIQFTERPSGTDSSQNIGFVKNLSNILAGKK
jgi:hypothetical protein